MRQGIRNVLGLTAVSGIVLSVATVALLTMSNSKGTGFIGDEVINAYQSKGIVSAFQTAGKEASSAVLKSWEGAKKDASRVWGAVQQMPAYASAKQACAEIVTVKDPVAGSLAERVERLKEQARVVFNIPSDVLDSGSYGLPIQPAGVVKLTPDGVKRRPKSRGKPPEASRS